jgi:hypothetical protein
VNAGASIEAMLCHVVQQEGLTMSAMMPHGLHSADAGCSRRTHADHLAQQIGRTIDRRATSPGRWTVGPAFLTAGVLLLVIVVFNVALMMVDML